MYFDLRVFLLSAGFVGSMLLYEVLNEDLWKSFREQDSFPKAIGFYVALFQFACSAVGAIVIKVVKHFTGAKKSQEKTLDDDPLPLIDETGSKNLSSSSSISRWENWTHWTDRKNWKSAHVRSYLLKHWLPYLGLTVLVFLSTALANQSVSYVPYVLKVVFKSSKLMPTMVVSSLLGNNTQEFTVRDYTAAAAFCAGIVGFAYGSGKDEEGKPFQTLLFGCTLLSIAVCSDAFLPNAQQKVMAQNVSPEDLMFKTNLLGTLMLIAGMSAVGEFWPCVEFSIRNPYANFHIVGAGWMIFSAVFCMTSLVKCAGSVYAVAVGTARKAGSVVVSYLLFPKPLTSLHVVSLLSVGVGMVLHESNNHRKRLAMKALKAKMTANENHTL